MKKLLILLCLFAVVGCSKKDKITSEPIEDTNTVSMELTYSYESSVNDSQIEMIQFKGALNTSLSEYNQELYDTYDKYVRVYGENEEYYCQLYNYPISNEHYLNLSYVINILPAYNHNDYGTISSVSYDITNRKLIDLDGAYELANTSEEELEEAMNTYFEPKQMQGIGIKSIGFYIDEQRYVHFIISYEATDLNGDSWANFYQYEDGEITQLGAYPFENELLDELNKELFIQKEDGRILEKEYKITYKLDGGENDPDNPATYTMTSPTIELKPAIKEGYAFEGWYTDKDFEHPIEVIQRGSAGNLKLYAKYIEGDYTIEYELDGGINSSLNPKTYNNTIDPIILKDATKDGYTFDGWYKDSTFIEKVTQITSENTGDLTLYAKWIEDTYKIYYSLNGGTNGNNPTSYKITSSDIILSNPSKDGYEFLGWYKDASYTTQVTIIKKGSFGEITLYALWKENSSTTPQEPETPEVPETTVDYLSENKSYALSLSNASVLMVVSDSSLNGIDGQYITVGVNGEETFEVYDHYFVSRTDSTIYKLDIVSDTYVQIR